MTNQALTISTRDSWLVLQEEAKAAFDSGLLPKTITSTAQAITIALAGRELGVSTWRALNGISVINGKAVVSGELMLQLVLQHQGPDAIVIEETDERHVLLSYRRRGSAHVGRYEFTYEQADRAGLTRNPVYRQHPARMILWRAVSHVARMRFPDVIAGAYVEGEIDAEQEHPASYAHAGGEPGHTRAAAPAPRAIPEVVEGTLAGDKDPAPDPPSAPPVPAPPVWRRALHAELARRMEQDGQHMIPMGPDMPEDQALGLLGDTIAFLLERIPADDRPLTAPEASDLAGIRRAWAEAGVPLTLDAPTSHARGAWLFLLLRDVRKRALTGEVPPKAAPPPPPPADDDDADSLPF